MSPRGRVLVVDDSLVVRRIVSDLLARELGVEVQVAPNGRLGLAKVLNEAFDLVILDIEMPELDGLATLREIVARLPKLPVLIFSAYTERAGTLTLDALALGARDYVTKPTTLGNAGQTPSEVQGMLVAKTKALLGGPVPLSVSKAPPLRRLAAVPDVNAPVATPSPVEVGVSVVVIGASTGGPNALAELLAALPGSFPVPILIAQHMPPLFTKLFAERLDGSCALEVREAKAGETLSAGQVRIAPGDFHLEVTRPGALGDGTARLHQGPPENGCRPSVDVLFRSAAEAFGGGVLGVVLTGMGQDGQRGSVRIKDAGGRVVVQDERSSVVFSMPGAVVQAGAADAVVPLEKLASAIVALVAPSPSRKAFP